MLSRVVSFKDIGAVTHCGMVENELIQYTKHKNRETALIFHGINAVCPEMYQHLFMERTAIQREFVCIFVSTGILATLCFL